MSKQSSFAAYLHGPTLQPGESKLIRKIDFFILTFCCFMYFVCPPSLTRSNSSQDEFGQIMKC